MTDKVPRRSLPFHNKNLPETVPIVGLGCSSFSTLFWSDQSSNASSWTPETMDPSHEAVQEWIRTIRHAIVDCGITLLDTAPWYGHGTSEVVIGWALQQQQDLKQRALVVDRTALVINTKVGRYEADPKQQFDFSRVATLHSVKRSLRRMQCDYIDVLQLHDPEFAPTLQILLDETIPTMLECRDDKKWCRALGMTGYPLRVQHQILQASLERFGRNIWDQSLVYSHFNLHDTSLFSVPVVKDDVSFADFCQEHSMVLLAAAPLSMGLLTKHGPPLWHPASPNLKEACRRAALLCEQHNVNISTLAIIVALSHPRIPCTLIGMKHRTEVEAAVAAARRFHDVDSSLIDKDDHNQVLKQVLTEDEFKVLQLLRDPKYGPFAQVWADGSFCWDGVQQVRNFWRQVPAVATTEWQAT